MLLYYNEEIKDFTIGRDIHKLLKWRRNFKMLWKLKNMFRKFKTSFLDELECFDTIWIWVD